MCVCCKIYHKINDFTGIGPPKKLVESVDVGWGSFRFLRSFLTLGWMVMRWPCFYIYIYYIYICKERNQWMDVDESSLSLIFFWISPPPLMCIYFSFSLSRMLLSTVYCGTNRDDQVLRLASSVYLYVWMTPSSSQNLLPSIVARSIEYRYLWTPFLDSVLPENTFENAFFFFRDGT